MTKKKCLLCRETTHFFNDCNDAYINIFFDEHEDYINKNYIHNIDFYMNNIIDKAFTVFGMLCTRQFENNIFVYPIIKIFIDLLKNESFLDIKILSKKYGLKISYPKIYQIEAITNVYIKKIKYIYQKIIGFLLALVEYNNYDMIFSIEGISSIIDFIVSISIVFLVKYCSFDHNNIVNNFYSLYNNNKNDKLLKGIHIGIDKLFDYRYVFTIESEYHVKNWSINLNMVNKENNNEYSHIKCPICLDNINNDCVKTNCNHYYCSECFDEIIKNLNIYRKPTCSLCRENINFIELSIYSSNN